MLVSGNFLPSEAYIEYDNFQYRLRPGEDPGTYTYTFGNVQKDTKFRIYSGEIKSEEFTLEVILIVRNRKIVTLFDSTSLVI